MLNKLYKNPAKVDKLQTIVIKHIKQAEIGTKKIFMLKSIIFIFLILRKTRNHLLDKWLAVIQEIIEQSGNC